MIKYDTGLFGYGFTLSVFNNLKENIELNDPYKKYLDFNVFLDDFFNKPSHAKIIRKFDKLFDNETQETKEHRKNIKKSLCTRYLEIRKYGFERWVSKYVFDDENKVDENSIIYIYILYNYWADLLMEGIWSNRYINTYLENLSRQISKKITHNIYTTNFDIFMDQHLPQKHIHGCFKVPLTKFNEIVHLDPNNKSGYEYSYLFGGGGIEKLNRLANIKNMKISSYCFDFFDNNNLDLGNLLIYGMSFGKTEYINDYFLEQKPQYKNDYYMLSVDGHILKKLNKRLKDGLINSITISYYSESEKSYLTDILNKAGLLQITKLLHVGEIKLLD